jgi:hypothetical protein
MIERKVPDFGEFLIFNARWNPEDSICLRVLLQLQNGVDYATRMNLYNLIFQMVILIPLLTQPP